MEDPALVRVDFSNDKKWVNICKTIENYDKETGFKANVSYVSHRKFQDKSIEEIKDHYQKDKYYNHTFVFIVDSLTIKNIESPVLCLSLTETAMRDRFRIVPSELWMAENNLSTSNLLFDEFFCSVDKDGVFRSDLSEDEKR